MNVLILSASTKVLLVRAFKKAVGPEGGMVLAADLDPLSAGVAAADRRIALPRTADPAFPAALGTACRDHAIDLVVPTRDQELAPLAALAPEFRTFGVTILVSSAASIALCQDKRTFSDFCRKAGIPVAPILTVAEAMDRLPVFVRPRVGAAGVGARRIDTREELGNAVSTDPDLLIQPFISAPEYSIDVLCDLDGVPLQAVVRERVRVRGGESTVSRVDHVPELEALVLKLAGRLGLVGHSVMQAFMVPGQGPFMIEVNPRFGGASNLSIEAGLASPERIVGLLQNRSEARNPRKIAFGLTMLRHSDDILVPWHLLTGAGAMPS